MSSERQDHTFRQAPPNRVALRTPEFDGRAYEVGSALGINCETVGPPAREKQQGRLNEFKIGHFALGDRERACLEQVQMTHTSELQRLAQVPGEERPGRRRNVGEQGGEGVHWYDLQYYRDQTQLIVLYIGNVQARTIKTGSLTCPVSLPSTSTVPTPTPRPPCRPSRPRSAPCRISFRPSPN